MTKETVSNAFKLAEEQGRREAAAALAAANRDRDTAAPGGKSDSDDPEKTEIDRIAYLESAMMNLTDLVQLLVAQKTESKKVELDEKEDPFLTPQTQFRIPQPAKHGKADSGKTDCGKTVSGKTDSDSGTTGITRKVADYKPLLRLVTPYEGRDGNSLNSLLLYIETVERYLDSAKECVDYLPKDAFNLAVGIPKDAFNLAVGNLKGDAASDRIGMARCSRQP